MKKPDSAGPRADLFSVGVMLHRFITGRLPGPGIPAPSILNPQLGRQWDELFEKALHPLPEARFGQAKEMSDALARLLETWTARRENSCQEPSQHQDAPRQVRTRVRGEALKVVPAEARALFGLDRLLRPLNHAQAKLVPSNNGTIFQPSTGLTWEAAGSDFPLTWPEARDYLDGLNLKRFAGRGAWRLPKIGRAHV